MRAQAWHKEDERLRVLLAESGKLSEVKERIVNDYRRAAGISLREALLKLGFVTGKELAELFTNKSRIKVTENVVAWDLVWKVPFKILSGYKVIPVSLESGEALASEGYVEQIVREEINNFLGRQLQVVQAEEGSVGEVLEGLSEEGEKNKNTKEEETGKVPPGLTVQELCSLLLAKELITEEELRRFSACDKETA